MGTEPYHPQGLDNIVVLDHGRSFAEPRSEVCAFLQVPDFKIHHHRASYQEVKPGQYPVPEVDSVSPTS